MKLSNLSALNEPYAKKVGILFAGIFILLEIVAKLTGTLEATSPFLIKFSNLFILLALSKAVFSKEKTDDERTRIIRYFSLKTSLQLLIGALAINYLGEYIAESIYIVIASLILYLLIFHLSNYYNPSFIFKEKTKKYNTDTLDVIIMVVFIIVMLYNIIKTIITT